MSIRAKSADILTATRSKTNDDQITEIHSMASMTIPFYFHTFYAQRKKTEIWEHSKITLRIRSRRIEAAIDETNNISR